MDLDKPMTLREWRQSPPLPGMEQVAQSYEDKWEELLIERGVIIKMANGSTLNCEMAPEEEPLRSLDNHINF